MVAEQYERAKQLLREKAAGHNELAQLLVDREVIYAEDVERIFGKRPWTSRTEQLLEDNAHLAGKDDNAEGTPATNGENPATSGENPATSGEATANEENNSDNYQK